MGIRASQSGRLPAEFPVPTPIERVVLRPLEPNPQRSAPFFPGERLTTWIGAEWGGPRVAEFLGAVEHRTSARFVDSAQSIGDFSELPAVGDVDLDGDLDLVVPTTEGVVVLANDSKGTLVAAPVQSPFLAHQSELRLVDLDDDGDLDLVPDRFNDGHGNFSAGRGNAEAALAVGDLDADGDLDLITTSWAVSWNDGHGSFSAGPAFPEQFGRMELGDVDGDGDLDAVGIHITDASTARFLCKNDGHGNFTLQPAEMPSIAPRELALADFDDDGDLDLFVADWGWPGKGSSYDRLWLNDGRGNFSHDGTLYQASTTVVVGDLDGDGDLDLLRNDDPDYSVLPARPKRVFLNDGRGRFVDAAQLVGAPIWSRATLADFDGDSDLDVFLTQRASGAVAALWLND
jgi:hypothetical protein